MTDDASQQPYTTGGASHPGRGNGLPAPAWMAVCDIDPRLAAPLLDVLREADVAAYVAPSTGSTGHYLERTLPDRPTDRLWVDARLHGEAQRIVTDALPALRDSLEDERWAAIVATLQTEADVAGDWPEVENAGPSAPRPPETTVTPTYDDDHFVPPDPPPLPPAHPVTKYGWTALLGGLALLLLPKLFGYEISSTLALLAIAGIIGGFVTLVLRMKDSRSPDDDPDDGAVV